MFGGEKLLRQIKSRGGILLQEDTEGDVRWDIFQTVWITECLGEKGLFTRDLCFCEPGFPSIVQGVEALETVPGFAGSKSACHVF